MLPRIFLAILTVGILYVGYRFIALKVASRDLVIEKTDMVPVVLQAETLYVDIHEVTNRQYSTFAKKKVISAGHSMRYPDRDHPRQPAAGVKLMGARAFCKACGKRLMTIEDFRFIAGSFGSRYEFGDDIDTSEAVFSLNYMDRKTPEEVMSKKPNEYGIYDLTGNVWELLDSRNSEGKILVAGGAYYMTKEALRLDSLCLNAAEYHELTNPSIGFRCVR